MRTGATTLAAALAFALMAVAAPAVHAESVTYEINMESFPGYVGSYFHSATHGAMHMPNGVTYYGGGTLNYEVSGTLTGLLDRTAGTLEVTGGELFAESRGYCGLFLGAFDAKSDIDVAVTGGNFETVNGRPSGVLHTVFSQLGTVLPVTFAFVPYHFSGPANSWMENQSGFVVWGNNTEDENGLPVSSTGLRIGADLVGRMVDNGVPMSPHPEPGSLVLFGLGGLGLAYAALRRRRARA